MRAALFAISMLAATLAPMLLGTSPAAASGGLSCSADEKGITVELEGGVTRGMGGPLFSFAGRAAIEDASVAEDLRATAFELAHVAQYWLDGAELKLRLYRERDGDRPHGYVELLVDTKAQGEPDEGVYAGTFTIATFDGTGDGTGDGEPKQYEVEGQIECFAE